MAKSRSKLLKELVLPLLIWAAAAPSASATVTFKSKLTLQFTAVLQDTVEQETADGFVSTTEKVTIVNKDLLAVYPDWADVAPLPAGANFAVDEDFRTIIVDKDGSVLYDADALDGFIDFSGDIITQSGRYGEKDDGSYTRKAVVMAAYDAELFDGKSGGRERSAELDPFTDSAEMTGLLEATISESLNVSRQLYRYQETDRLKAAGAGTIESAAATLSGSVVMQYDLKNDQVGPP